MERLFGTDGVRGIAYKELSKNLAYGIGLVGSKLLSGKGKVILVGCDTRISSQDIKDAVISGIIDSSIDVIDLGVVPTPALAYLTKNFDNSLGAYMITASHNPYQYNGIKILDENGEKIPDPLEDLIEKKLNEEVDNNHNNLGSIQCVTAEKNLYIKYCLSMVTNKELLKGKKIALDCANGSTYEIAFKIFNLLQAEVLVINNKPNGVNINDKCGSTHIESLQNFVLENKCDVGFAFDGDGDRLIAVDHLGNKVNGDKTIGIIAAYLKENNQLTNNSAVVTIMSNSGLKKNLEGQGINVIETKVGDRHVFEAMKKENSSIGGEESGHIIINGMAGDGIKTALILSNIMVEKNATLFDLSNSIELLPGCQDTIEADVNLKETFKLDQNYLTCLKECREILNDDGKIIVRASGTENVIRILVEAKNEDLAQLLVEKIKETLLIIKGKGLIKK